MGTEKLSAIDTGQRSKQQFLRTGARALSLFVTLTAISACSSSSDGGAAGSDNQQTAGPELTELPAQSSVSTVPMRSRLITAYTDTALEGWACVSDRGFAFVYMFFEEGVITGFNDTTVGIEVFLDPENMPEDLDSQIKFLWTEQSNDSLLLESPNQGVSVSLNNVRFADDDQMSAYSSTHGQLYCQLQSGDR